MYICSSSIYQFEHSVLQILKKSAKINLCSTTMYTHFLSYILVIFPSYLKYVPFYIILPLFLSGEVIVFVNFFSSFALVLKKHQTYIQKKNLLIRKKYNVNCTFFDHFKVHSRATFKIAISIPFLLWLLKNWKLVRRQLTTVNKRI